MATGKSDIKHRKTGVELSGDDGTGSEDEYEEEVMILELNGVLDGESLRQAVNSGQVVVRRTESDAPLIQIGSSVYTGKWAQTVGTDLIFQSSNKIVHNSTINDFEMNDMFHSSVLGANQLDLIGVSSTRLISKKALISTQHTQSNESTNATDALNIVDEQDSGSQESGSPTAKRRTTKPKSSLSKSASKKK